MIVVTGAAGFIGSCVVARLNSQGRTDLILVDHYEDAHDPKRKNLDGKKYAQFFEKQDFLNVLLNDHVSFPVSHIIHMGACSSTVLEDAEYFDKNNFQYSRAVAQWALKHNARLIYASSAATYGDGSHGYHDDADSIRGCRPLNLYGQSKQKFDEWILDQGFWDKVVGLKFFNVFGPNEYHKDDMRSVVAKAYERVLREGRIALFKSYKKEYADGEQKRDFIYVKDAVDIVMYFFDHPEVNGIFNVGTGQARTWNDLAHAFFTAIGKNAVIEYIEMPEVLRGRYQYFTEADVRNLRRMGYTRSFTNLEDAIADYVGYLKDHSYL